MKYKRNAEYGPFNWYRMFTLCIVSLKRFLKLTHLIYKHTSLTNYLLKVYLGNQKWFFYGVSLKNRVLSFFPGNVDSASILSKLTTLLKLFVIQLLTIISIG